MALADIDAAATRRLIQEIADEARAGFAAGVTRSAELDVEAREAAAKDEADLKAVLDRREELAAAEAAAKTAEEKAAKGDRPATLTLGAEELRETQQPAAKTPEPEQPAAEPDEKADEKQDEKPPSRTLKLGARDEDEHEPPRPRPRPMPRTGDDDMSGRTWLR